ncbi:MAG: hypothetical protein CVU28_06240 [Betaproteobacteria bacterium HGW-Betaproteobacteria-21]|nr:MAG: hypothetical protein CVU28_06240 [Betaproteobacteria bacterium HGW-Betaproteobacteria-21]
MASLTVAFQSSMLARLALRSSGTWSAEAQRRSVDPRVKHGLELVATFQEAYPEGHEKAAKGNWPEVERSLTKIRQSLGLEGEAANISDPDARRVRGFTDFLLAEAHGYGRNDRDAALKRYTAAHDLFQRDGDLWVAAWIWFYVGQYLLDQGEPALAGEYAVRALEEAGSAAGGEDAPLEERDAELLANNFRLLGDVALAAGDLHAALPHYCRATFYAYVFQAIPEPADSYTMAFYREITGRIAARAFALAATDAAAGRAFCQHIQDYWQAYWARHPRPSTDTLQSSLAVPDPAAIAAAIFPPALSGDVLAGAADYAREVKAIIAPLEKALDQLAGSAPPHGK